jgi:hypothetical protein
LTTKSIYPPVYKPIFHPIHSPSRCAVLSLQAKGPAIMSYPQQQYGGGYPQQGYGGQYPGQYGPPQPPQPVSSPLS